DQLRFYVNTLALRARLQGGYSYNEVLKNVKQVALGAYEHQAYPFDELVDALHLKRDLSRNPLLDVQVILQHDDAATMRGAGLDGLVMYEYQEIGNTSSTYDLVFYFVESTAGIKTNIIHNIDVYSEETVAQLADHFTQILAVVTTTPDKPINQLEFLTEKEKAQLLIGFNGVARAYSERNTLVSMFEDQVARASDSLAVVFKGRGLTYRELNETSNQLSDYLRKKYRIKPNELVGIKLERSERMIIAILGVLKSGAAYIPIDIEYPEDRIDYIIEDSKCRLLIDNYELECFIHEARLYSREENGSLSSPGDLAYVIYTSGSTGTPKGVPITHGNLMHSQAARKFTYTSVQALLLLSSISFDVSVACIFSTLCDGGTLYIAEKADVNNVATIADCVA